MNKILKIIGIILISFLLIFLIYKLFNYSEDYFNKFSFDSNKIVLNNTKIPYLDTIIQSGLQNLPIDNVIVQINDFNSYTLNSFDKNYDAHIIQYEGYYIIYIKKFSKQEYIRILSHELIHLKQYYTNELKISNNITIWKGDTINVNSYKYDDRPWEKDALDNQYELEKKMRKILFK